MGTLADFFKKQAEKKKAAEKTQKTSKKGDSLSSFLDSVAPDVPPFLAELNRICDLPIVEARDEEEREAFMLENIEASFYEDGFRLWDNQIDSVLAYMDHGGLFGPQGVGFGKTLISLMIAGKAWAKGLRKSLLLVPPQVYSQLVNRDIKFTRARVTLHGVPFRYMGFMSPDKRMSLAHSNLPGCYIMPYSMASTANAEEVLNTMAPELIIADEAHHLRHKKSARTQRVFRYIAKRSPEVCAMSGTITSKSIKDYHHILKACLREKAPLPLSTGITFDWSNVLDSEKIPTSKDLARLKPLLDWYQSYSEEKCPFEIDSFRKAYNTRLVTAPGVVATKDKEIGVSLTIQNTPANTDIEGYEHLLELIRVVDEEWLTPSGDEIDHAIHKYKWNFELSAGFYNKLIWPLPSEVAKKQGCSLVTAEKKLESAQECHEAKMRYRAALRGWLENCSCTGLDTPMLVANSMRHHQDKVVGSRLYKKYTAWKTLEFESMPERKREVVRICPYKILHAKEWAGEHDSGVIWYHHQAIGQWLHEMIPDALFCPAGKKYDQLIAESEGQVVIASIGAHKEGKNLQFHRNQLYVQFPRSAVVAEQSLGRLHRSGQEADELIVDLCLTTEFDRRNFAATLNDGLYVHQTVGRQKIIYCSYDPLPKVYPPSFLKEQGFQPKDLDSKMEQQLYETFSV